MIRRLGLFFLSRDCTGPKHQQAVALGVAMLSFRILSFAYFFFFPTENVAIRIATENELRFIFMGDWGGSSSWPYKTKIQLAVAKEMGKISDQFGSDFTVALGKSAFSFVCCVKES